MVHEYSLQIDDGDSAHWHDSIRHSCAWRLDHNESSLGELDNVGD